MHTYTVHTMYIHVVMYMCTSSMAPLAKDATLKSVSSTGPSIFGFLLAGSSAVSRSISVLVVNNVHGKDTLVGVAYTLYVHVILNKVTQRNCVEV